MIIFLPIKIPVLRRINWNKGTKTGKNKEAIPKEELVMPTHIESNDSAHAKYNASFFSIIWINDFIVSNFLKG